MNKIIGLTVLGFAVLAFQAQAARKVVLDARIEEAIEEFYEETSAGEKLAKKAEGMLVFPSVAKAGLGMGGEYGEGALIIDGDIKQYYNVISGSIGFQIGLQSRRQILLFMDKDALKNFRDSEGWEAGVDGSVAIANLGAGGEIDMKTLNEPVVAFVFGNKGLMYNLSLEGSKFNKIEKKK
ncbi:MAG: YSC84-related protein [Verrucomicrobiota bacterium]